MDPGTHVREKNRQGLRSGPNRETGSGGTRGRYEDGCGDGRRRSSETEGFPRGGAREAPQGTQVWGGEPRDVGGPGQGRGH